jgi:hypothetical protein
LGKEHPPTDADKKTKWDSKNEKALALIRISISPHLRFHLQRIDEPYEALENHKEVNIILFEPTN